MGTWKHPHSWGKIPQNGEKAGFSPDFSSLKNPRRDFLDVPIHRTTILFLDVKSSVIAALGFPRLGACRTYASRLDFCPFSPGASLLPAPSEPPSFAFAALHGGFSSLSLSALFGSRVYDSPPRYRVTKMLT